LAWTGQSVRVDLGNNGGRAEAVPAESLRYQRVRFAQDMDRLLRLLADGEKEVDEDKRILDPVLLRKAVAGRGRSPAQLARKVVTAALGAAATAGVPGPRVADYLSEQVADSLMRAPVPGRPVLYTARELVEDAARSPLLPVRARVVIRYPRHADGPLSGRAETSIGPSRAVTLLTQAYAEAGGFGGSFYPAADLLAMSGVSDGMISTPDNGSFSPRSLWVRMAISWVLAAKDGTLSDGVRAALLAEQAPQDRGVAPVVLAARLARQWRVRAAGPVTAAVARVVVNRAVNAVLTAALRARRSGAGRAVLPGEADLAARLWEAVQDQVGVLDGLDFAETALRWLDRGGDVPPGEVRVGVPIRIAGPDVVIVQLGLAAGQSAASVDGLLVSDARL
jgi:hypothetical protein